MIRMFAPFMSKEAITNAACALRQRMIGEGETVKQFESILCGKFDFRYALLLNNGTAGLRLALAVAGVGPGDEVIIPEPAWSHYRAVVQMAGARSVTLSLAGAGNGKESATQDALGRTRPRCLIPRAFHRDARCSQSRFSPSHCSVRSSDIWRQCHGL